MLDTEPTTSAQYSASDIAKYFIWKSAQENRPITNKKLQKLVYYSQAWYLVSNSGNQKLFPEKIEAWIHGPVVPSLYHEYKRFGFGEIDANLGSENSFSKQIKTLLDEVWNTYGGLDGNTLEALTHSELPWREARKNSEVNELSDTEINTAVMTNYYTELKNKLDATSSDVPILNVT